MQNIHGFTCSRRVLPDAEENISSSVVLEKGGEHRRQNIGIVSALPSKELAFQISKVNAYDSGGWKSKRVRIILTKSVIVPNISSCNDDLNNTMIVRVMGDPSRSALFDFEKQSEWVGRVLKLDA